MVVRGDDGDDEKWVCQVEGDVAVLLGPYTERKHNSLLDAIGNFVRLNQVFEFSKVTYSEREDFFLQE